MRSPKYFASRSASTIALSGPGRQISADQKQIHLDNTVPSIRIELRPSLAREAIGKFRFPILPIVGEKSPKRFEETLRAMQLCLPDNMEEFIIIPNAAHGMNRQNPQAFNAGGPWIFVRSIVRRPAGADAACKGRRLQGGSQC